MTTSVNQAWAAALPDRPKADAPRQNGKGDETGFAEAVKFGGKQARHSADGASAGEERLPRLHVEFKLPDRLSAELLAVDARGNAAGDRDADELDGSASEASNEPASPGEHTAAETPFAFRSQLPPIILLGGLGRHQARPSSSGDASGSGGTVANHTDAASSPSPGAGKAGGAPVEAEIVASTAAPQGAETSDAGTPQSLVGRTTKSASGESEAKPVPTVGKHPASPPDRGPRGDAATEPAATAKPVAADRDAHPDGEVESTATASGASRDNASDAPGQTGRVTILAQQNVPAPATPFPGLTAAPLLTAITSDGSWRELAPAADLRGLPSQNAVASTHSLKVQLHPAELGMVTASLRFAGEQLTVELQVESAEAQQRLSADSDTIVKSLRALGLEVDRVTIQQSVVVQPSNARTDTNAGQNGQPAPDRQSFTTANSGGGNGQAGGQQSGRSTSHGAQVSQNTTPGGTDRTGGGLYI